MASVSPPAGYETMIVIGFLGHFPSARTGVVASMEAAAQAASARRERRGSVMSGSSGRRLLRLDLAGADDGRPGGRLLADQVAEGGGGHDPAMQPALFQGPLVGRVVEDAGGVLRQLLDDRGRRALGR